eukprot:SAG22_NODE_840_length_6896_cov_3.900103_1_plen_152_part_00
MPVYEVEEILDEYEGFFKVKWAGYVLADSTWETQENCSGCEELIAEFRSRKRANFKVQSSEGGAPAGAESPDGAPHSTRGVGGFQVGGSPLPMGGAPKMAQPQAGREAPLDRRSLPPNLTKVLEAKQAFERGGRGGDGCMLGALVLLAECL